MRFTAYGHPNIKCSHLNTFEFTKDKDVSLKGDCIVGVRADFELSELRKLLVKKELLMKIVVGDVVEEVRFISNPGFGSNEELVVRRSEFVSGRTLGIKADKAAVDFRFKEKLKNPDQKIVVELV